MPKHDAEANSEYIESVESPASSMQKAQIISQHMMAISAHRANNLNIQFMPFTNETFRLF